MFLHACSRAVLIHLLDGLKQPFMLFNDGEKFSSASDCLCRHSVEVAREIENIPEDMDS